MRSNALLMSASGITCVIIGSISILPSMYQSTIFGHVGAAARAAEGGAFPDAAGDELERAGGDFLAAPATPMMMLRPSRGGRLPAPGASP
jgi:hypothetical protein